MKQTILLFIGSLFLIPFSLPFQVLAQPINDDCANAIPLTIEGFCTTAYTNIAATNAAPNGGAGCNDQSQTVWFSFVATQTSHVVFLENFDTDFDPVFQVYSGGCGALSALGGSCTDGTGNGGDETATINSLNPGTTYLIRVNGFVASDEGTFCMYVLSTAPDNDDCDNAITIIPNAECTNGTNINATSNAAPTGNSCQNNTRTVWYKFVAQEANNLIHVESYNASFDVDFALYSTAAATPNCTTLSAVVSCIDANADAIGEQGTFSLIPGRTYYIRVSGFLASDEGLFCVEVRDRPDNDLCANATPLTLDGACVEGSNIFATDSGDPGGCGNNATGTVWYTFSPAITQNYIFRLTDPRNLIEFPTGNVAGTTKSSDMAMQIFSSNTNTCGGVLTSLACIDAGGGDASSEVGIVALTATNTYFIKVNGSALNDEADYCIEVDSPPANDDCSNATLLTVNNSCQHGTTYASGTSAPEPASSCGGGGLNTSQTVWYKFVATSTEHEISVTNLRNIGSADLGFDVFTSDGTCGGLGASFACQDISFSGGDEVQLLTGLTPTDTYYIRVSGFGAADATDFCIKVLSPPLNDTCAGVIPLTMNFSCVGGTNINATSLTPPLTMACGNNNAVVWYSFVATQTSHSVAFISQSTGGGTDLVFEVFSSDDNTCAGNFTSVLCKDTESNGRGEQAIVTGLTPNDTYYILVAGDQAADEGNFCISVSNANDLCANAVPLAVNAQCVAGGNNGSTSTGATDGGCEFPTRTVWYSFVAISPSATVTVEPESNFDAEVTVFSALGNCTGFTEEACIDNGGNGGLEQVTVGSLTVGDTYYVMVDGQSSDQEAFCISVTSEIPCGSNPPPGNTCDAAPLIDNLDGYCGITSNTYTQNAYLNLQDSDGAFCAGAATIENNSFLKFTAGTPTITFEYNIVTNAPQGGATCDDGIQMQIFSVTGNDCTTGIWEDVTENGCINPSGTAGSTGTLTAVGLITGQVYYVMFDGFAGDECGYALRVPKGNGIILPVEMTSFTGKNLADVNRLTWTTVSEIDAELFEVERSHNGMQFETIGKVIAKGNSQTSQVYNFNDIEPINGINYYRLKLLDVNDTIPDYSQTIEIRNEGGGNQAQLFTFYPNPSIDFINYTVYSPDKGKYKFEFMDIQGKVVKWETRDLDKGNNFIRDQEVVTLADGLYILRVTGLYGSEILYHKFIKR